MFAATAFAADQTLITNARIWDGTSDTLLTGKSLLVEGSMIVAIGKNPAAEPGARRFDAANRIVIPGIIEAHTHLASPIPPRQIKQSEDWMYVAARSVKEAEGVLMRGWTTVRDIGGPSQGLAKAIDEGHVPGPRIYTSAMTISQTSGHGDARSYNEPHPAIYGTTNWWAGRYSLIADGPAEVKRAVRESLRHGATAIKVMAGGGISSQFDPLDTTQYSVDELRAAVEAAEQWHTYVAVHAYTDEAVRNALEAGVKVIEHGHMISEDTLKLIHEKGAFISSQTFAAVRRPGSNMPSSISKKAAPVMDGIGNLMGNAARLGIPVAFGSDSFGSSRAYKGAVNEFEARLEWFTSLEILKQATSFNAKLLELTGPRNPYPDGPLGVIEEGAYADLLIVDGNPLEDVRVLMDYENNIRLIMKDGVVYKDTL
jgi:imidazolonepropionase-like amidohydrolase